MRASLAFMLACCAAAGCSDGGAPELSGLADHVAQVGTELRIELDGTDPDGDRLDYRFRTPDPLVGLAERAAISVSPSGAGVFRWTPNASDLGEHAFDFTASDGDHDTTVTITIDVRSAIGSATAPIFREPLGTGTTLDLAKKKCVDVQVVVDDQDTAQVTLTQEEPIIEGAQLTQINGRTATWQWCPTKAQQDAEMRYTLTLGADDGDNPKTIKDYLVVLRGGSGTSCPGNAPTITHTANNLSTILDLALDARFTDDVGLKDAPLLYYSTTPPTNPPTWSQMIQVSTFKITGTNQDGHWAAGLANPVAGMPAGTQHTFYYVFVADDDDDPNGNCDHSTISPVYQMTVTSTAIANAPICAPCTADAQCGTGDLCVPVGSNGDSFCMQACGTGCPSGYTCSAAPVTSIGGASALQCVPQSGSCTATPVACADDSWEDNDTRTQASANPVLAAAELHDLVSCPKAVQTTGASTDDDWFKLVLPASSRIDVQVVGGAQSDLDLHLYRSDGTVVTKSTSLTSDERIERCLAAATYYLKVNGYGIGRNPYLLTYDTTAEVCDTACVDDTREDDDTFSQARSTTQPSFSSTGNVTCPNDDDWYRVRLFTADVMTVDLTFTQSTYTQDLDLHLYKGGIDLTPCSPTIPGSCSTANGQSANSNEHTVYTVPAGCEAGCDYFVVVRGYDGSTAPYAISISVP